jgi:hypothetical protein
MDMNSESWCPSLAEPKLEIELLHLALVNDDGVRFEGAGRVSWTPEEGIRIRGSITAPSSIYGLLPFGGISEFELEGATADGRSVTASNVRFPNGPVSLGASICTLDSVVDEVDFREARASEGPSKVIALLRPIDWLRYPRPSNVDDDNPYFGSSSTKKDWMKMNCDFGLVAIRQIGDDLTSVYIEHNDNSKKLSGAVDSVRLALSFFEGREVRMISYVASCGGEQHQHLCRYVPTTKERLPPPLGLRGVSGEVCEDFIRNAANFFHTDKGRPYSDHLRMCWSVRDSYGSAVAAVTCSFLEAILSLAQAEIEKLPSKHDQNIEKLTTYLKMNLVEYDCGFIERVKGFLGTMRHARPQDLLYNWAAQGVHGVEKEDADAFRSIRNPASHGRLLYLDKATTHRHMKLLLRIENLVNKLVLSAMEHKGFYHDYPLGRARVIPPKPSD